jgi:hypothetical protein
MGNNGLRGAYFRRSATFDNLSAHPKDHGPWQQPWGCMGIMVDVAASLESSGRRGYFEMSGSIVVSTDWKRFFKFLNTQTSVKADSKHSTFLPEDLLNRAFYFLRPLGGSDAVVPAEDFLASLPVERLFDMDERLRSYYGTPFRDWPENALAHIASSKMNSSMRQALFFLAACHSNGRIREDTLELLPRFPGRLTLAVALIRSADWVPVIRGVAQQSVASLLDLCSGEDVVAVWPLVIRLGVKERLDSEWFGRCVEGWMLRRESSPWRLMLLKDSNTSVRAWAYRKSLEAQAPLESDLLDSAIRDPDPRIALYALGYSADRFGEGRAHELVRFGIEAKHPIVRRESLRILAGLDSLLSREIIYKMLQDRSAGVRSLAAYLLREKYSERAVEYWRSVIDHETQRPALAALTSLADNPESEDIPRFKRWLPFPGGLVRMLCLRGIVRAGGQLSDKEFLHAVSTPGTRVQRELVAWVRRGTVQFDLNRLMITLTAEAATPITLEHLRGLLQQLNHWERLALVLSVQPSGKREMLWFVTVLGDWIAASNGYAPLGSTRRSSLLELLEKRRSEMDDAAYSQIEQAILRH